MNRQAIDAYRGALGDADAELEALGTDVGERFIKYAHQIVSRRRDHWRLQTFAEFRDIPVYKADFADCFTLFCVEDYADQGLWLTLMFGTERKELLSTGVIDPSGRLTRVRREILLPRMEDFFA